MSTDAATHDGRADEACGPTVLLQKAEQYRLRGEYLQAEALYRQAIGLIERSYGGQHVKLALALNALGVLYKYMGRFDEAAASYQRAMCIVVGARTDGELSQTETASILASLYHNLGGLEHARGQFASGEPYARRSVELRRTVVEAGHPDLAADEAALAALLDGQEKYEEAELLYRSALAVFERHFGPEHYEVAVNLNNLAALHQRRNEFSQAEPIYQRALAIKEKLLGGSHPDVAMTVHNLAVLAHEQDRHAEAERHYRRSLSIFSGTLEPDHPKLTMARQNYARLPSQMQTH